MRNFFLALLGLTWCLAGCSTTRQACLPGEAHSAGEEGVDLRVVQEGQVVTVFLKSGEKVKGEVLEVDLYRLVLGKPSNYGYREDTYQAPEIARIEASYATGFGKFVGGVVGVVTVTFMTLLILLAIFPPDFSGLS